MFLNNFGDIEMSVKMLKEDGSLDQLVLPGLDSPMLYNQLEVQKRYSWILSHFNKTHKTESSFYLTFCRLDKNDISFLKELWNRESEWEVFRTICSMYKIRIA